MNPSLNNVVTTWWSDENGTNFSPPFPPYCCHCMKPASNKLTADFDGINLEIPYCSDHFDSAKEYFNNVVRGKKRGIVRKISIALAVLSGFWIIFWVLPESDLLRGTDGFSEMFGKAFQIEVEKGPSFDMAILPLWVQLVLSAIISAGMFKVIPYLLDRRVLHKGAYDLGYWVNRKIILALPGIIEVDVDRKSDPQGRTGIKIAFLKKAYADIFLAEQDTAHLE